MKSSHQKPRAAPVPIAEELRRLDSQQLRERWPGAEQWTYLGGDGIHGGPDGSRASFVRTRNATRTKAEVLSWGEGARVWVVLNWKDQPGAHTFGCEVRGGRVAYYDPQDPSKDASTFIRRAKRGAVWAVRVDNLTPTDAVQDLIR
jgi:hypothetical protein